MKYLTHKTISAQPFAADSFEPGTGAALLFLGVVRGKNHGKKVKHLTYEAYEVLAEALIENIRKQASQKWRILESQILHRLGKVIPGEIAVAIEVCSAHRDEAYQASRFLIDEIKSKVPIWKKEYFENGIYQWGLCEHHGHTHAPQPPLFEINSDTALRKDIRIVSSKNSEHLSHEHEYLMSGQ